MSAHVPEPRTPSRRSMVVGLASFAVAIALIVTGGVVADLQHGFAAHDSALASREQAGVLFTAAQDAETDAASTVAARVAEGSRLAADLGSVTGLLASFADDGALGAAASAGTNTSSAVAAVSTGGSAVSSPSTATASAATADSAATGADAVGAVETITAVRTDSTTTAGILGDTKALEQARADVDARTAALTAGTAALDAQITTARAALLGLADSAVSRGQSILDASALASTESRDALAASLGAITAAVTPGAADALAGALTAYVAAAQAVQASQSAARAAADAAASAAAAEQSSSRSSGSSSGSGSGSGSSGGSGSSSTFVTFPPPPITWNLTCTDIYTGLPYTC